MSCNAPPYIDVHALKMEKEAIRKARQRHRDMVRMLCAMLSSCLPEYNDLNAKEAIDHASGWLDALERHEKGEL